jgi:hypothetical protein
VTAAAAVLPRRALPWSAAYSLCRISLTPIGSLAFAESSPTWSSRSPNLGPPRLPPIGSLPSIGNRESAPPLSAFDLAFDWESGTRPRSRPALDRLASYSSGPHSVHPPRPALSLGIGRRLCPWESVVPGLLIESRLLALEGGRGNRSPQAWPSSLLLGNRPPPDRFAAQLPRL